MRQKYKLDSDKKAYLQLDFAFAVLIFAFFVISTYSYFKDYESAQEDSIEISILQADSRDICYLLRNTPGEPSDWETQVGNASFLGIKDVDLQSLNLDKMDVFNSSNYFILQEEFGLNDSFVFISVDGLDTSTNYLTFGFTGGSSTLSGSYSCYSNYNSELARIYVEVWK